MARNSEVLPGMALVAVRLAGVHVVTLTVSTESGQPPYETPPGAGLGSSGAVGVALLGALNALRPFKMALVMIKEK